MKRGAAGSPSSSTGTGPIPSSSENRVVPGASCPRDASTQLVPTVGWPANGTSRAGVKIRTRAAQSERVGGSTNVVSERFISRATACISSSARPRPSRTTASGLPESARSVNTSTCAIA